MPSSPPSISVLLADDHAIVRRGLRLLLEQESHIRVVGEAGGGREAIEKVRELSPDVLLMDISMPDLNGLEATRHINRTFTSTRVVALSVHSSGQFIKDMFHAGAVGYLLKESAPEELPAAIHAVMRGEVFLSTAIAGKVVSGYLGGEGQDQDKAPDGEMAGPVAERRLQESLIRTKLYRQELPRNHVVRHSLLERMSAGQHKPLTLVSAPAGYGKSVLVSAWLERLGVPSAWLSLEKDDDDPRRFLTYFLAAVASIFPDAVPRTASMARAFDLPPVKEVSNSLIDELDRIGEDYILALDDVHHLRHRSIFELLGILLQHPPAHMHLVLVGRRDPFLPISALRAQGRITEIRTADLRFTPEETALFLRQELGREVDMSVAASWTEKSEGWCTGLRLAAMAMRSRGHGGIPDDLPGNVQYVLEYLFEEVLASQPPEARRWLMDSSILDRFCAPLCEALADPDDGTPSAMTGWGFVRLLKEENLFLINLDAEKQWFRYHHLFQRLMRNQLERHRRPEDIATLHERAGDWFARNGMIDEAIQHALKAGNAPKAAQLVARHRHALYETGAWIVLESWLERIPEALVDGHPDLLMAKAQLLFYQNRFHSLPAIVDRAESLLTVDGAAAEPILGEIQFFRGVFHLMRGDGHLGTKSLEAVLPRIPATKQGFKGMALIVHGLAGQMIGRRKAVVACLADVLDDPSSNIEMQLRVMRGLLWVQLISGDLCAAETVAHQMRAAAIGKQNLAHLTLSSHAFGLIQFHRCEFDEAIQNFKAAAEHGHLLMRRNRIDGMIGLALALQAKGRWDEASGFMADLATYAHASREIIPLEIATSGQARLRLHSVEADGTGIPAAIDGGGATQNHAMLWWLEVPAVTHCRVLVAEGSEASLRGAEKRLRDYLRQNRDQHNRYQAMDIMALLAVTLHRLGQPDEALKMLDELVHLAEPGGWVRPFVEAGPPMPDLLEQLKATGVCVAFVERLFHTIAELKPKEERGGLQAVSRPQNAQPPLIEPLTNREQDILELLARRWQNKEIADRLCVSPETVKSHLKNIFQKLNVPNRIKAVEKAHRLGLLPKRQA
jgi:LuxR family maltose regulon positive regulatory protein